MSKKKECAAHRCKSSDVSGALGLCETHRDLAQGMHSWAWRKKDEKDAQGKAAPMPSTVH